MRNLKVRIGLLLLMAVLAGCTQEKKSSVNPPQFDKHIKIVSLNGTLTEILCKAGYKENIVGIDVTSTYPKTLPAAKQLGYTPNVSAEAILSANPSVVMARAGELKPEVISQLDAAGVLYKEFPQEYSKAGTFKLIDDVATFIKKDSISGDIRQEIETQLNSCQKIENTPKVVFIYARGIGNLMVAGEETQMDALIKLAGGENAIKGFRQFRPLTPEALVEANPDIIVMFDEGVSSLKPSGGLSAIPSIAQTKAGKNEAFVTIDAQLAAGFGPRLGKAVKQLNEAFAEKVNE